MTKLILIPTAQTEWRAQGRLAGDAELALTPLGRRQAVEDAAAVASLKPRAVRCGPEQATKETGAIIAEELSLKLKPLKALREMDLGHWEGLTGEEFRERFGKVYRQWRADPTSVEPPDGETVVTAAERLSEGVRKIAREFEGGSVILAVGPFACAILHCLFRDDSYDRFWECVEGDERRTVFDLDAADSSAGPQAARP